MRNDWVSDSGSSSGSDFKLKSEGTSYVSSGKKNSSGELPVSVVRKSRRKSVAR